MYQKIFEQGKIGNVTFKNRLVMSPMGTSLAEMDGSREAAVTTNDALISFSPVLSGIS